MSTGFITLGLLREQPAESETASYSLQLLQTEVAYH